MKPLIIILSMLFIFSSQEGSLRWDYNKSNWTQLMKAIYFNNTRKYKKLILKKKDINLIVYDKNRGTEITALDIAIRKQNVLATKLLIDSKLINNLDESLILASQYESVEIVKNLLENGANPNYLKNNFYSTILAAITGSDSVLQEILNHSNKNINLQRKGVTPLMRASSLLDLNKVKILLSYGADKYLKDNKGKTAYDYINYHIQIINNDDIIIQLKELLQ